MLHSDGLFRGHCTCCPYRLHYMSVFCFHCMGYNERNRRLKRLRRQQTLSFVPKDGIIDSFQSVRYTDVVHSNTTLQKGNRIVPSSSHFVLTHSQSLPWCLPTLPMPTIMTKNDTTSALHSPYARANNSLTAKKPTRATMYCSFPAAKQQWDSLWLAIP